MYSFASCSGAKGKVLQSYQDKIIETISGRHMAVYFFLRKITKNNEIQGKIRFLEVFPSFFWFFLGFVGRNLVQPYVRRKNKCPYGEPTASYWDFLGVSCDQGRLVT